MCVILKMITRIKRLDQKPICEGKADIEKKLLNPFYSDFPMFLGVPLNVVNENV